MSSILAPAPALDALRHDNIFLGTSSWKYEGWLSNLHDPIGPKSPALSQQLAQHPCADPSSPVGARLLLKEGRPYQEAVDNFSPYEKIQDPQPTLSVPPSQN